MEVSVIAERKEIEFQGFAFHQFVIRDIADDNAAEIRLACFRAKACKFRAVQLDQIRRFLMLIGESFQDRRIIGTFLFRMAAAKSGHTGKFFFCSHNDRPFFFLVTNKYYILSSKFVARL